MTSLGSYSRIHPFPARMASEIALKAISALPSGSTVMDPMCGSGTVLIEAIQDGHQAIGFDLDPLAVLIARTSTNRTDPSRLVEKGNKIADCALGLKRKTVALPWIDDDPETSAFVDFWFAREQQAMLRRLAYLIAQERGPISNAFRLAISKTIITKEPKASLARDTSHSRPHKVGTTNSYDVNQGFREALDYIGNSIKRIGVKGKAAVSMRDARHLPGGLSCTMDMVVTSPPYGNAIDYLRGHRLALVWLGYTISRLREIRGAGIGSERSGTSGNYTAQAVTLARTLAEIDELKPAIRGRLVKYAGDMQRVLREISRSLKPNGQAVLVVANSQIGGAPINNVLMIATAAEWSGMKEVSRYTRDIPANHRYLPPPANGAGAGLGNRMKQEVVLTFRKPNRGRAIDRCLSNKP